MKPFNRRSVTAGLAAAVTTIPALGLAIAARSDPLERIKHHTRELERAMRDCYGVEVQTLTFDKQGDAKPCVFAVAHTL
jgi:hypothetical protein